MSPSACEAKYSAEWKTFLSSTAGQMLVWWLDQQTSAKSCIRIADINERLGGAAAHLNVIIGEQRILNILATVTDEKTESFNPPDTFAEPEQI